jgi:hypothetical protein
MTSFSFGQTNFDVMNPDAELLDSLVFDKIKQYQKDLFNKKVTNEFTLQFSSKVFNASVILGDNKRMSDTLRSEFTTLAFYYEAVLDKTNDTKIEITKYLDSSYINYERERLFFLCGLIGRKSDCARNEKLQYINYRIGETTFKSIINTIDILTYYECPLCHSDKYLKYDRISLFSNISKVKTYEEMSEIIFNEIISNKKLKIKIPQSIGMSCDFTTNRKEILTTILLSD